MTFSIMVACTSDGGIGRDGKIPWYNPEDLKYFQEVTTHTLDIRKRNALIMGRKTWESLPKKPLRDRRNVVLTRSDFDVGVGAETAASFEEALSMLSQDPMVESIHVIGGGEIYREALMHPECVRVHVTKMDTMMDCDTYFPLDELYAQFGLVLRSIPKWSKDLSYTFTFEEYARVHHTTSTKASS